MSVKIKFFVDFKAVFETERIRSGASREDVATALNISDSTVHGFESGYRNWDLKKTIDYARYLGIEQKVKEAIAASVRRQLARMIQ